MKEHRAGQQESREDLLGFLKGIQAGEIEDRTTLVELLQSCWASIDGGR